MLRYTIERIKGQLAANSSPEADTVRAVLAVTEARLRGASDEEIRTLEAKAAVDDGRLETVLKRVNIEALSTAEIEAVLDEPN